MNAKNILTVDFVIIGAGILGLTIALRLYEQYAKAKIIVIEKEETIGLHASGRNSGVLHSGIYYPPDSLKAKLCAKGAHLMRNYCEEHGLPYAQYGKIILPISHEDDETLALLYKRGLQNKVNVEIINEQQLQELEPSTNSMTGKALFVAETAVVDPKAIMKHLYSDLKSKGIQFYFNQTCKNIDFKSRAVPLNAKTISYQHLINTAGLYADKIAKVCGIKNKYTMLPFKGLYYELNKESKIKINRLIYPVPDMNVPFLGVHFTKAITGKIYAGPTAIPALGREHYRGIKGIKINESINILYQLCKQYQLNEQGFRAYAHSEISRFLKPNFVGAAKKLIPGIKTDDLVLSQKVGIRAQLLDITKRQLIMDFLVERTDNETHVLNAVSPAFTSSLSLSKYIVSKIEITSPLPNSL